jgi:C-terminal processing protease CtpA/Prc
MSYNRLNSCLLTLFAQLIIISYGFRSASHLKGNGFYSEKSNINTMLRMSEDNGNSLSTFWKKNVRSAIGAVIGCSLLLSFEPPANADQPWTDQNRLAAEAWRAVDEIFYDRTFNGIDWFKVRQEIVKKDYKTDEEVYKNIASMLVKVGDKYTRFLPPAQYFALMNSAQGELTGVGLELQGTEDGKVRIVNIEDLSPAKGSGILRGDMILNVDGSDTKGLSPEEVASLIRGKKDTKASLRLNRDGKEIDFTVVRQSFRLKGVSWSKGMIKGTSLYF